MDKKIIIKNFSRAAGLYDRYADIQKISALELLGRINQNGFHKILEIGCGTGAYTHLLREKFNETQLKAVDISAKMVEVAQNKLKDKKIDFVAADAEHICFDDKFDLITSNACFQWFEDLEKALIKYKNMLNRNGTLSFSVFGPLTFRELDASLKSLFKRTSVGAAYFITKEKLKILLEKNFKEARIEEKRYQERFSQLSDLLKKIKYTGANGAGLNTGNFFGPQQLKKLETIYLNRFKHIRATYQIFFCQGLKP